MKTINAKYVVFDNRNSGAVLKVSNERIPFSPAYEDMYEDATITFLNENTIILEGFVWQFGFLLESRSPVGLGVHPDYIKQTKFRKKPIVRRGWYRKSISIYKSVYISKDFIIEAEKMDLKSI